MRWKILGHAVAFCLVVSCLETVVAEHAPTIYRCRIDGVLTFSDRPCGTGAELRELDPAVKNTYEAPPPSSAPRPKVKARSKQRPSAAADRHKHEATCERLAERLKDIRAQFRAGYKATQGERLKQREARLKSQIRAARCS